MDRREILCGTFVTCQTDFPQFLEAIAPGMAEFWATAGAIWPDMLLAEPFVTT